MTADALERLAVRLEEIADEEAARAKAEPRGIPSAYFQVGYAQAFSRAAEMARAELAALHAADHDTPAPGGAPEIAEGARG